MRKLKWSPTKPIIDMDKVPKRLEDQSRKTGKKERHERNAVLNDIPAAHRAAMDHLENHWMRWPIRKTDSYVVLNGSTIPTWWVATSTRRQVTLRLTQDGSLVTTLMRGPSDIGATRPVATPIDLDDPRFLEDIEFARELLKGLRSLASSKITLLAGEKQDGRHRR